MRSKVRHKLKNPQGKRMHLIIIRRLTLLTLVGIMIYTIGLFLFGKNPITNVEDLQLLPGKGEKIVKIQNASNITDVEIEIIQNERVYRVFSGKVERGQKEVKLIIDTLSAGMKEGPAKVNVKLRFNGLFPVSYSIRSYIDTNPPRIELISLTEKLVQGSAGAIKVKVQDANDAYVEFQNGKYKLYSMDGVHYLALFPVESSGKAHLRVLAFDKAGNIAYRDVTVNIQPSNRKPKPLNLSYGELFYQSEPRKLWEGSFLIPKEGNVLASNNGVVLFVDLTQELKTVILDHGLGVMSVYMNLVRSKVKEGQYVKKGSLIGNGSGSFYFCILVQGKEVNSSHWTNIKWIREIDKILD